MTHLAELPAPLALLAAALVLAGAFLSLAGSFGLLRMRTFYDRLHAPTIATSMGISCVLLASMLVFTALQSRLVIHELLVGALVVLTTPVTLMLVARAALHRDRLEKSPAVPRAARPEPAEEPAE
ncbi:cation:proton antiporter [Pseudoroseomonas rhizosphaerae]|uniref:Cation:proton antiporter n=1 Tax=Teichococcus rhizosphaerae TaxID=1335062 RepID=A0A2C7A2A1_9PROT|nr:monovalent cation/H(+) antiporter subunit G [Pseudoroseomonas rhizosphaerae]PHK94188.1 cation:proton antiporter [Pseudoroseomonas rhizosphaerae]